MSWFADMPSSDMVMRSLPFQFGERLAPMPLPFTDLQFNPLQIVNGVRPQGLAFDVGGIMPGSFGELSLPFEPTQRQLMRSLNGSQGGGLAFSFEPTARQRARMGGGMMDEHGHVYDGEYGDVPSDFPTTTPLEAAIDSATRDPRIRTAMRLAVMLEGGNFEGNWGVGDQGMSFGPFQINTGVHRVTRQQAEDPRFAVNFMLKEFEGALQHVPDALWQTYPKRAAMLLAGYAERPEMWGRNKSQPYDQARVDNAWNYLSQRRTGGQRPQSQGGGGGTAHVQMVVPGGRGKFTTGGTHGSMPAADVFAPEGTPIYSPVDGNISAMLTPNGGNSATMRGSDGRYYYFAHAQRMMRSGNVRRGDIIGYVGRTGNARNTPPHLHYSVASDPSYFQRYNGSGNIIP